MNQQLLQSLLKPITGRIAIYVALGLVGLITIRRANAPDYKEALVIAQTKQVIEAGKRYREQRARDAKEIGRLQRKTKEQVQEADSLRRDRANIQLPPITPAACEPYAATLSLCERETLTLRSALQTADSARKVDSARAARAETRSDTLELLLKKQPHEKRFLGLPRPRVGIGVVVDPANGLQPRPAIGVFIPVF